jgi:uncharacterized lipoprotein YehR (DUF1307 family)
MLENIKRNIVFKQLDKYKLMVAVMRKRTKDAAEKVLGHWQKGIFQNNYGQIVAKSLN